MGSTIDLDGASGHLAVPDSGSGPGAMRAVREMSVSVELRPMEAVIRGHVDDPDLRARIWPGMVTFLHEQLG